MPQNPVLKKESQFRYIGKDIPRLDIQEKVNGTARVRHRLLCAGHALCRDREAAAYGADLASIGQGGGTEQWPACGSRADPRRRGRVCGHDRCGVERPGCLESDLARRPLSPSQYGVARKGIHEQLDAGYHGEE